jgi:photosystem II stability/assembly factor-like uncharacterized protein
MKISIKFLGFIALVAIIGFVAMACGDKGSDTTGETALTGTIDITGTAQVGQTLTADGSNLDGYGTISYQWKRGYSLSAAGTDIPSANARTYMLVAADEGKYITVTVTRAGYSGSKTSDPTSAVIAADIPELTGTVNITGNAMVGQTLTANIVGLGGNGTVTYQWKRSDSSSIAGTDITSATASTYKLVAADEDKYITVTVSRAGYSGSKTSNPTAAVATEVLPFWTVVTDSKFGSDAIQSVAYGSNKFVAVGNSGKIAYSSDGITWNAVLDSTFGSNIIMDVTYGTKWVAVGSGGKMAYSADGVTWTTVIDSTFSAGITGVATTGQKWVAVGVDGRMAHSSNGETWTAITSTNSTFGAENINSVATGLFASYFVAVGSGGKMAYSSDGENWYTVANSTFGSTAINGVAYSQNNRFVAVGNSGKMAYSSDGGATWTAVTNSPFGTTAVRSVTWRGVGNRFYAVGNDGKTAYSADNGVTWTAITDNSFGSNDIYDIACDRKVGSDPTWVAVGTSGKIAYSVAQ